MLITKKTFTNIKKHLELLRFGAGVTTRKNLNRLFKIRDSIFFKKKLPESENYPYSLIDPFEVFGEDHPYGDFNLVGSDWKDKGSTKPLAILWGFNNWKLGFVSAYLPEYRTAFAPRKIRGFLALLAIRRFPIKPSAFIFWGYTEPWLVSLYAKLNKIKILRMEDGFLRSSALGATHSTPYSLLLDSRGMHYNPDKPSDLEVLLNTYDFTEEELEAAGECLELMKALRLSKYNLATLGAKKDRGIKTRRKVAVLGQVDNDMAMRLGNPDGWSMTELIRLAKIENPDADVYFRPHPDVYTGIRRSRFRLKAVEKYCKLASPEVPLVDFLETLDQVYTVTSLSGLEALLRGVKVTVVGNAFYAGWGLTDDRLSFPSRTRPRTVLELFAAAYMKYPRYLANVSNNEIGFKAACYRIKADIDIHRFELFDALSVSEPSNQQLLLESDFWPMLLFKKMPKSGLVCNRQVISKIDFNKIFSIRTGRIFQIGLLYAVCGICADDDARDLFIEKVRRYIDRDVLNELLVDLNYFYPGGYVSRHMAWLLLEVNECEISIDILTERLKFKKNRIFSPDKEQLAIGTLNNFIDSEGGGAPFENLYLKREEDIDILLDVLDHNISLRHLDESICAAKKMLLSGIYVTKIILDLAKIAAIRFDNHSTKMLAEILQYVDIYGQNRNALLLGVRSITAHEVEVDAEGFLTTLMKLVSIKPDRVSDAVFAAKKFDEFHKKYAVEDILCSGLNLDNEMTVQKALGYLAVENSNSAVSIVENLISLGGEDDDLRVVYSQSLSYAGKISQSLEVMKSARAIKKTSANYRESLRLCVLANMYDEGLDLLNEAKLHRIELGDMHPRKIYFGARNVREAFKTFTDLSLRNTVATYYPEKYCTPDIKLREEDTVFFIAIFGPGDEIRFASIYNMISEKFSSCKVKIACDPRLQTLFKRSFPKLHFVPVDRPRNSDLIDIDNYSRVPGSDLTTVIDDSAVDAIGGATNIMLVTDMLHVCLESYEDFPGVSYLTHNTSLAEHYRARLPSQKLLIGLSWRSSLTTHSRNEHYLTIEELEPIFQIEELQFVNFQYDECQCELDWVEARYPGKLINISEIDQYNDFESVAGLMKCMDLMIAPATTVVELSGALGCPTWLLSNSSELYWRKIDATGTDVWHHSITHVESKAFGDKASLVSELCSRLKVLSCSSNRSELL